MPNRTTSTYFVEVLPCPTRSMSAGDAGALAEPFYIFKGYYICENERPVYHAAAKTSIDPQLVELTADVL